MDGPALAAAAGVISSFFVLPWILARRRSLDDE